MGRGRWGGSSNLTSFDFDFDFDNNNSTEADVSNFSITLSNAGGGNPPSNSTFTDDEAILFFNEINESESIVKLFVEDLDVTLPSGQTDSITIDLIFDFPDGSDTDSLPKVLNLIDNGNYEEFLNDPESKSFSRIIYGSEFEQYLLSLGYPDEENFGVDDNFFSVERDPVQDPFDPITGLELDNTFPDIIDDSFSTDEDTAITLDVLSNDTDADGDSLTITEFDATGLAGTLTDNGDGTFSYDPNGAFDALNSGESATDTFTYTASDGLNGTGTATVTITINGVDDNTPPDAKPDSFSTDEDTAITFDVLLNDTDADGDSLTITEFDATGLAGILTDNGGGSFSYDPNGQFEPLGVGESATDSFTYTIDDGNGNTDTATVTININGVNEEPVEITTQPLNPITGTSRNDNLVGTDEGDEIAGRNGNDGITGKDGDDVLKGGGGRDAIDGGAGNDELNGGAGIDTAVYQFDPASVSVNLSTGEATDGFGNSDVLTNFENVIGSESGDVLIGNDDINSLTGRGGDDYIDGAGGNDLLLGGAGNDVLNGGAGSDRFIYLNPNEGEDTIEDFETGVDKIAVVSAVFGGGLTAGTLSEDLFVLGNTANNSDQRFVFNPNSGQLFFNDGSNPQVLIATINPDAANSNLSASDIQIL